jgi:hypothetical protein
MTLSELTAVQRAGPETPPWLVDIVCPDDAEDFQGKAMEAIDRKPRAKALRLRNADQLLLETVVRDYGRRFTSLHLCHCPRVSDLTPVEELAGATQVAVDWNQRATRLWNFKRTPKLIGLQLNDFSRLPGLDDVAAADSLEELVFGNAVWMKWVVPSLSPVAGLSRRLRRLCFYVKSIGDRQIQPIAQLRQLEHFDCSTNLFTTEQLAWLKAHLPDSTKGRVLEPIYQMPEPLPGSDPPKDVMLIGKRKPFLNSTVDSKRIQRHVDDFWANVERFREHPSLPPE